VASTKEAIVHANVRRYRCDPGQVDEIMHLIDTEFAEQMTTQAGFCDYQAIDCGEGILMTVSIFQDQGAAERSTELASEFVKTRLSDFQVERIDVTMGEVKVSRAAQWILEPAHH
jgi:hypothetical protein